MVGCAAAPRASYSHPFAAAAEVAAAAPETVDTHPFVPRARRASRSATAAVVAPPPPPPPPHVPQQPLRPLRPLQTLAEAEAALPARAAISLWRAAGAAAPHAHVQPAPRPPAAAWFRAHLGCNALGVALAVAGLIAVEQALGRGTRGSVAPAPREWAGHQRAGATALAAVLLQLLIGAFRPHPGPGATRAAWRAALALAAAHALVSVARRRAASRRLARIRGALALPRCGRDGARRRAL